MKLELVDFESAEVKKVSSAMPQGLNTNINFVDAVLEKDALKVSFDYLVTYMPDNSFIRIHGRAIFSGPESKPAYEEWKKQKSFGGVSGEQILNAVNYTCSINSVFISRVFALTPPIVPPTIKFNPPGVVPQQTGAGASAQKPKKK
ncbi:TPA: hypothetical protein HA238_01900 [Candidatus Micrarchaeota archaeon]|nr:hypothetical protein [Candidatus Micrarchaeota archaeon]